MSKTEKYGISNKGILCSIALLMTLIMCMFFPICVKAEENYKQDGFEYEVIDQKAYIVDYFGTGEDVIVPAELGGYTVVGIRQGAFTKNHTIKKLTFSEGLVFLERYSIYDCNNLEYLYFPSTYGNGGDSMRLGGVMTSCDNLATVEISPENKNLKVYEEFVYEVIDQKAYIVGYFGTGEDVIVPAELGGYTVVGIRQCAFSDKNTIKKLTFSEGLVFLEPESIINCNNLEYVYFPSTYGNGGDSMGLGGVMYDCDNLATVEISPENKNLKVYEDALYSADMKTLIFYPPACTREVLSIPDGVEVISSDSCRDNLYLKEITMTDSVKTIGYWAFLGDFNVERIRISENCTVISQFALQALAFETLHIPASVEFIMPSAISSRNLKEITVDAENKTYHSDNGVLCSKNTVVRYPEAKADEKYVVEDGITSIDMSAFHGAKFLKEVVLPESMESIESFAFFDCYNLEKINLPDGITYIGRSLFANNANRLNSISIPSSMTYVPEDIISYLNGIIIPESVEMIEEQDYLAPRESEFTAYFYGNVPENVDNILQFSNERAFTVYYPKVSEEWDELKEAYSANNIEWIPMDIPIQCIQISKENLAMEITSSQQLSVSYKPLLTSDDTTVTWESSDLEVAVVDNTGMVTAVAVGNATITAKVGEKTASCNVIVNESKKQEENQEDYRYTIPVSQAGNKVASYEGCNFYEDSNGNKRCYKENGVPVINEFKCDGTFTYYFQTDGTCMKSRLTYHPDGEHVIYFDEYGHEVFSNFANVKMTISGEAVDDFCFFDVHGYLYVDVVTFDQTGTKLYYANQYGVIERGKWFEFSDTCKWADGNPFDKAGGKYGCAMGDGTLLTNAAASDWEGRLCYLQGNGVAKY